MEENTKKRKDLSPEAVQEKQKVQKQYESLNLTQHPSIMKATDLQASPVSPKSLNIVKTCEIAGIREAGAKIDVETVYNLILNLTTRVSGLEDQLAKKDDEIFNLRKDQASLEKQIRDLKDERKITPEEDEENTKFLSTMKAEIPTLSDDVAKNQRELNNLKEEITKLKEDRDETMVDVDSEQINTKVEQVVTAQVEDRKKFETVSRRSHLEREQQSQYTMRETIRVTGVPYKQGENTNDLICRIAFSIGVAISDDDISVSHRTGRRIPGQPRAIVCKFTRRTTKYRILKNKKLARNITHDDDGNHVKIFIDEKLTPMRANLCKFLREQKIQHSTKDGKIFIPKENSTEQTVLDTPDDFMNWEKSNKLKMDLGIFPKI